MPARSQQKHCDAIANRAVCRLCENYGLLTLMREDVRQEWLRVSCRRCQHEWRIHDADEG